jgi:predicted peptidase
MTRLVLWMTAVLAMEPLMAAERKLDEGQQPRPAASPGDYHYQLFLPRGYLSSDQTQWPLMIFLHGSGERGTDVELVKVNGPPKIVTGHPGFPFVLVSPQVEPEGDWDIAKLDRLLQHIRQNYRVDPHRIYLTGLSLGGRATWQWSVARPELFAAVVPIAGWGEPSTACALKDIPVWAFHGDGDNVVPPGGSFAMVEAIRQCGGSIPPRLTIYPGMGHQSWAPAYDDPALYRWLLEQRRKAPAPELKKDK